MIKKICLILIIFLAFGLRLYRIDNPIADWHSWRQADTSAVSRNFIKYGFDFLHPRFDDLSNVASGHENPLGYRFVEFPFYNFFQAGLAKFLPVFNLEVWGRLVSIFFSLGSLILLYLIVKKFIGERTALLAALFWAILPYNIFYSRVILPEPMLVFVGLLMVYFFSRWIENSRFVDAFLALLSTAAMLLIKPYGLVYLFPVFWLAFKKWRFNYLKWLFFAVLIIISLLPFIAWRGWMERYPEGIPAYDWLFNEADIRFKGAFFWWLFAERVGKLILGYWGLIFLGLGLLVKKEKERLFFVAWLAGILVYLVVIAGGNVRHDYYQIITVPVICVFLAKGLDFLLKPLPYFDRSMACLLAVVVFVFMLSFSWYQVRDFFNINNPQIVIAGKAAAEILPESAKVIAPYGGDTSFLYQTNRQGWPVGIEIEKMINLGAQYYLNVNFGPETRWVIESYCLLAKTENWVIVDLTKKCFKQ